MSEIIGIVAGAVIGGTGFVGMLFHFMRRYFENKLSALEIAEQSRREARIKRSQIDDELIHATGRLLFWLYRAIVTESHNGELDEAFHALQSAETRKKEWDRQILAEVRNDK